MMEATHVNLKIDGKKYTLPVEWVGGEVRFRVPASGTIEKIEFVTVVQTYNWVETLYEYGPIDIPGRA